MRTIIECWWNLRSKRELSINAYHADFILTLKESL